MSMMNFSCRSLLVAFLTLACLVGCQKSATELLESAKQRDAGGDTAGAILDLKSAIQQEPENGQLRFMLGGLYNQTFDGASAEKELRKARSLGVVEGGRVSAELGRALRSQGKLKDLLADVQAEPHVFESTQVAVIHALRGRAHYSLRQLADAKESLRLASTASPGAPDVVLLDAMIAATEGRFEASERMLDASIKSNPRHFETYRFKAELLQALGRDKDALAAYSRLLDMHPTYFGALVQRSTLLMKEGSYAEAKKDVDQLLKVYRDHPQGFVQKGMLMLVQGRPREALDSVQLALKRQPQPPGAIFLAGLIYQSLGSLRQAESLLTSYTAQAPADPMGRIALAAVLIQAKSAAKAIETLQPLLRLEQPPARALSLVGDAHAQLGRLDTALEWYEKAVSAAPDSNEGRLKAALTRIRSGELDRGTIDLASTLQEVKQVSVANEILVLAQIRRGNLEEAAKAVQLMEAGAPNSPLTWNMKGAVDLAKGDKPAAERAFSRALEIDPAFFPAARNMALMDLEKGDATSARRRLESVAAKTPRNVKAYIELARLAPRIKATPAEVEEWLQAAVSGDSESEEAVVMLASAYIKSGDHEKARDVIQKAIAAFPGSARITNLAAQAQLAAGEANRAIATFAKAVSQDPKAAETLVRMAQAQIVNQNAEEAAASLRKALRIQPDLVTAHLMLAETELLLGRANEALKIAEELRKRDPRSSVGWVLEGDVHARMKRYAMAAAAYENAFGREASGPVLLKLHGVLQHIGRVSEGEQKLDAWIAANPGDLATAMQVALQYERSGNLQKATRTYESIVAKQPRNAVVLNNLAMAYNRSDDRRAIEFAERAYKLAPNNPAIADTAGWIQVDAGNFSRGLELLKKATELAPKEAAIRFNYARALVKAGNTTAAKEQFERVMLEFPKFSEREEVARILATLKTG